MPKKKPIVQKQEEKIIEWSDVQHMHSGPTRGIKSDIGCVIICDRVDFEMPDFYVLYKGDAIIAVLSKMKNYIPMMVYG